MAKITYKHRSFIIWLIGTVAILGLFLVFVQIGWPGRPDKCLFRIPNTCFCEQVDVQAVVLGLPGVRQPVNTWSGLYAIASALLVAYFVYNDRKKNPSGKAPNLISSHTWVPDLYVFVVLFLGLGSLWFHGSLKHWGGIVDGMSMYMFVAFLVFYTLRRLWDWPRFFWFGYLIVVGCFTYLHTVLPAVVNILMLVAVYTVIEVYLWLRTGKIMQAKATTVALWLGALLAIGVATFFWWASQTGRFLCQPESLFQPHGWIWHPLAGVMAVLLYFYWRVAEDGRY